MSKSDDEKAALQSGSGGAGLPSLAGGAGGGIRVPRSAFDKLTTTITPEGLSAQEFDAYESVDSGGFTSIKDLSFDREIRSGKYTLR